MKFVAHAPTRAASTLMSMPVELSTGVEMSLDAARTSAYATATRLLVYPLPDGRGSLNAAHGTATVREWMEVQDCSTK
jgi:hypothetical protein